MYWFPRGCYPYNLTLRGVELHVPPSVCPSTVVIHYCHPCLQLSGTQPYHPRTDVLLRLVPLAGHWCIWGTESVPRQSPVGRLMSLGRTLIPHHQGLQSTTSYPERHGSSVMNFLWSRTDGASRGVWSDLPCQRPLRSPAALDQSVSQHQHFLQDPRPMCQAEFRMTSFLWNRVVDRTRGHAYPCALPRVKPLYVREPCKLYKRDRSIVRGQGRLLFWKLGQPGLCTNLLWACLSIWNESKMTCRMGAISSLSSWRRSG